MTFEEKLLHANANAFYEELDEIYRKFLDVGCDGPWEQRELLKNRWVEMFHKAKELKITGQIYEYIYINWDWVISRMFNSSVLGGDCW